MRDCQLRSLRSRRADLPSPGTSRLDTADPEHPPQWPWCDLWRMQLTEQSLVVREFSLRRARIRRRWERQFQSRHALFPRVRNAAAGIATGGFDAYQLEQNRSARLRSREQRIRFPPRSETILPSRYPAQ